MIDQDKNSFIVAVGRSDGKVRWQKPRPEALSGASTPVGDQACSGTLVDPGPGKFPDGCLFRARWRSGVVGSGIAERDEVGARGRGRLRYMSAGSTLRRTTLAGRWPSPPGRNCWHGMTPTRTARFRRKRLSDARTKRYWEFIDTEGHGKIVESEWKLHLAVMAAENGLYVFQLGSRGDATSKLVWKYQRSVPQLPSVVVYRDVVYMLNDSGVLTTLDAKTGRMLRQDRVRGLSDNYYASPWRETARSFWLRTTEWWLCYVPAESRNCWLRTRWMKRSSPRRRLPRGVSTCGRCRPCIASGCGRRLQAALSFLDSL